MIKNWKTTLAGIATIMAGISQAVNQGLSAEALGLIIAGIGLLFGKDFSVRTEK